MDASRWLSCLAVLLLGGAAGDGGEPPSVSFPAAAEMVTVDVVVADKRGQAVPGLTADRFRLTEDGRAQEILQFRAVQVPVGEGPPPAPSARPRVSANTAEAGPGRTFAVVFDDLHLSVVTAESARRALREFASRALGPADRVVVASTGGEVWWASRVGHGREDLLALLPRLQGHRPADTTAGHITDWEAMRIRDGDRGVLALVTRRLTDLGALADFGASKEGAAIMKQMGVADEGHPLVRSRAEEVYAASLERRRRAFRVLVRVAAALAGIEGRKAIVLVSEGFVSEPQRPERRDLLASARRANAAVYFLNARGGAELALAGAADSARLLQEGRDAVGERGVYLDADRNEAEGAVSVAVDTGGFAVGATADLAQAARRIGEESRVYYLLGYRPPHGSDGRYHKISVEVPGEALAVQARRGYFAEGGRSRADPKAAGDSLAPPVRAALDAPRDAPALPLRLAAYLQADERDQVEVLLVGELDLAALGRLQPGMTPASLEWVLACTSRDRAEGARVADTARVPSSAGVPLLARGFRLLAGTWQARLVVRDPSSGLVGSVTHEFEVPPAGRFRLTTPVVTDLLETGPRPVPVAHLSFAPGAPVVAQFEVCGARPGPEGGALVLSGFTLAGPGGTLAHLEPTPLRPARDGRLTRMLRLPVPAEPGAYALTVTARDGVTGETLAAQETFQVGPSAPGPGGGP